MCEDEGTRLICQYVARQPNITILELLDCGVTPIGCEFLANAMYPPAFGTGYGSNLAIVKLDHNKFGTRGLKMMAEGLSQNPNMVSLSLTYCGITEDGSESIFNILLY